jgi:hypothetical protein
MTERVGRPWTTDEDGLLKQAVAVHGETDMWKTIALSVPGRTNKACRKVCSTMTTACNRLSFIFDGLMKRWLHSLSPSVKKTAWTKEEDALLLSLYAVHSTKWALIARSIPGRTDDACSKRYREALDPSLKKVSYLFELPLSSLLTRNEGRLDIGRRCSSAGCICSSGWQMESGWSTTPKERACLPQSVKALGLSFAGSYSPFVSLQMETAPTEQRESSASDGNCPFIPLERHAHAGFSALVSPGATISSVLIVGIHGVSSE